MSQCSLFARTTERHGWADDLFAETDPDGLRYYQREAVDRIWAKWFKEDLRSLMLLMATGLGKTQVAGAVARRWIDEKRGPVLMLAHRDELVQQARDKLEAMTGLLVEVEQAEWTASHRAQVVVGSTQSVMQKRRLEMMGSDRFSLLIPDEFHHYVSPSFKRPLEWFAGAKILGPTATPDRGDEKALGQICDEVAYAMDIEDGIDAGYLVPIRGQQVLLADLNLDLIGKSAGDLAASQLDEAMVKNVEGIVREVLRLEPNRQAICFFPGVKTAEFACAKFNELDPGSACFISGATEEMERKRTVADFKAGRFKRLTNCQVATEGYDVPAVSLIVQARPTLSRAFYAQTTGRGTRVLPGVIDHLEGRQEAAARRAAVAASAKPNMMILDFVGNSSKHALCSAEDVLGGNYSEAEVERAKKKRKPGADVQQSLRDARKELQELARAARVSVKSQVRPFDPFLVMGLEVDEETRYASRFGGKPASPQQIAYLQSRKVPDEDLEGLSFKAASRLMTKMHERQKKGLCTYPMLRQLQRFGVTDMDITFERAGAVMSYLNTKGWSNVDPQALNEILYHRRESGEEG